MTVRTVAGLIAGLLGLLPLGAMARPAAATLAPVAGAAVLQTVPAAQIVALAERVARLQISDVNRALVPAYAVTDQRVPAGEVAIASGLPQVTPTFLSVPITIAIDGRVARTVMAGFRITNYVRTVVAAHDVTMGTILSEDDLAFGRVPFSGRAPMEFTAFVGRKLRSPLTAGDVLYPELTIVNEIVHAGMPVLLIVHDGPVLLAADVVARSSGGLGDYVSIFDPQTQRMLAGVVTGPNTVELTLPGSN